MDGRTTYSKKRGGTSSRARHQQVPSNKWSKSPNARFTGPYRFFSLSRELRDMVYDEVWPKTAQLCRYTKLRQSSPLIDITAMYRKSTRDWQSGHRIPDCFLVSKAFLDEAMKQYYRNVDWKAKIPGSYFTTRFWLTGSEFEGDAILETQRELDELLRGSMYLKWIPASYYSRSVIELYKAWPMHLPILKKLHRGLHETNGRRTLHVTFSVALNRAKPNIAVDLSSLENIGFKLDKTVVDVIIATKQPTELVDGLTRLLETEIKRLGCAPMIGQRISVKSGTRLSFVYTFWNITVSRS
ncbi:hypothetical protein CC86DRAFT_404836 [Ophiobolus disseminans]|uniref:Uncharacterized protein n=1 Tax=Ophiobolus disseminans TaxID=1469910 RepID=A0A6A7A3C3_9PLEO|nr:hypothetical protein CC86DRAFT_404836 [Ophiobolus disseminans]